MLIQLQACNYGELGNDDDGKDSDDAAASISFRHAMGPFDATQAKVARHTGSFSAFASKTNQKPVFVGDVDDLCSTVN